MNRYVAAAAAPGPAMDSRLLECRQTCQRSDVGSSSHHATRKHAVVSAGPIGFAYDANGNVTSRGTRRRTLITASVASSA